ncbi:MAG: protein adenylyltransferase SelO [Planktomarina sp.]
MTARLAFDFDNTFHAQMDGFYVPLAGETASAPEVLRVNDDLASELGVIVDLTSPDAAAWFTGTTAPDGAQPLAMAYAGHQFGNFSPQLGDGRALLLGEVLDTNGSRLDIQLKGSGRTPFSRSGDGKAVLGPVLREYLMGEAMHALGIPTTRALAASLTGQDIYRNGMEKGAVLTRVAASHLRVGTFQFFAARQDTDKVRQLADYTIARHHPDLIDVKGRYLKLFQRVRDAQAQLIANWVSVGFVHGVMNTDNVAISGETIDYGPCAFMDVYDPKAVFSSIDHAARYAYGNQPVIGQWNISRFAETLIELINPEDSDDAIRQLTNEVNLWPSIYQSAWLDLMRRKLGLGDAQDDGDLELVNDLHTLMDGQDIDFTSIFRALAHVLRGDSAAFKALFNDAEVMSWLDRYMARVPKSEAVADAMDAVNPIYIPRNHLVEAALTDAAAGDMAAFDDLLAVLKSPYTHKDGLAAFEGPAPAGTGPYQTFCGT